jgi:peptidoglycan hydrolase-like protein with peptidoglycan-binding domain
VFAAVKKRQHDLGIPADGLVGKQTWSKFGL